MSFSESELAQDGFDASLYRGYSEIGNNASTGTVDSFSNLAVSINESNNKSTTTINDNTTSLTSSITTDVNANTDTATGSITTDVNANTDIQPKIQSAVGFAALFGDGRDGNVTVSGTTYVNENKQYANLTINSGCTLTTSNKYIHIAVSGILTISGSGKIYADGKGAVGGVGGAQVNAVQYPSSNNSNPGIVGTDGAGSGAGVEYLDLTTRCCASGGGSGRGGSGGCAGGFGSVGGNGYDVGGIGGTTTIDDSPNYDKGETGYSGNNIPQIIKDNSDLKPDMLIFAWGAGGAGGGSGGQGSDYLSGDNSYGGAGGHGGAGGGLIYIEAKNIIISSTSGKITANGVNGSNGLPGGGTSSSSKKPGGGGGAGGAGGGGCIMIKYSTLTNAQVDNSNFTVSGATGGTGGIGGYRDYYNAYAGTGGDGGVSGTGYVFLQQISK